VGKSAEPSVEEILESIKNVMERDSRVSAADAKRRKQAEGEELAAIRQSEEADEPAQDEILDLAELELSEVIDPEEGEDQPLIAEEVRGAMQENLAALAMLSEPPAKPQIVRSGETSLEGLTRELLRPMLAEWLDKNLPSMVEKLVQAEIARIAGKRD
jgi:cell pole-organizing protein PopZ